EEAAGRAPHRHRRLPGHPREHGGPGDQGPPLPQARVSPPTPPRLEMAGIQKRFGGTVALEGVGFQVAPGEVHALIGENGGGKSTLMKVLSGAIQPDSGRMVLDGSPYQPSDPAGARARGVAMIYQELNLAPHLSVLENVMLGMEEARWGVL